MSFHFILLYTMTVFIASIIPGPSMLLAITHGMQHGARKTMVSAMGNVAVTFIQASISVAGLGTILMASESVFHIIKWAGAAYLIYVGTVMMFSSQTVLTPIEKDSDKRISPSKMFIQSAMVTAGNPKAILFFTAIFPQFINPQTDFVHQYILLMVILTIVAFICFMIYALGGQKIVTLFSRADAGKSMNRIIGGTFIGTGIGLAASGK
ncbi:MAG: LysE family translocator [Desulfobacteraceae bacterium]|jgi:threonine/homoserine/homoserine lactone efflux protein